GMEPPESGPGARRIARHQLASRTPDAPGGGRVRVQLTGPRREKPPSVSPRWGEGTRNRASALVMADFRAHPAEAWAPSLRWWSAVGLERPVLLWCRRLAGRIRSAPISPAVSPERGTNGRGAL